MDFKTVVYNAAKDGKLYRLKVFLDIKPRNEVARLVGARTNGATPLVIACRNGHLDVAVYLLENCRANVEDVGSVTFDGETIEDAPPLWCAAAAGHLNVVKTLVRHNANVNSTTKTNSTPLRAACFDGRLEIAKFLVEHGADVELANRHGHTCLMIACFKGHQEIAQYLLNNGADANKRSQKGNTALHDCAESGSLEILKLLLVLGAKIDSDLCGTTPLLSAAVTGHASIVEYFIGSYHCTQQEKIDGLELLGATYVDKKRDLITALECWRRALAMRHENSSFPLEKPHDKSPISSYIGATEVRNFEQLDLLISDPDKMRMEALLVRERILGPGHPDTVYYIRYRGATYADNGNFERCIQLWMYALDVQQQVQEPLSSMTQSSLLAFTELFSYMMSEAWGAARGFAAVSFQDILNVFERALREIETALKASQTQRQDLTQSSQFHRTLTIAMHLIGLMRRLQLNKNEEMLLKKAVYKLVHMNPKSKNGFTPLHLACYKDSTALGRYPVFTFPSPEVVDLLLEVGACPNAVDLNNNTPLHITAMNKPCTTAVIKSLLSYGAHLDISNNENQTPLQLVHANPLLEVYPLQHLTLQCLCAQAINTYKIPYEGFVHNKLQKFIESHSSR